VKPIRAYRKFLVDVAGVVLIDTWSTEWEGCRVGAGVAAVLVIVTFDIGRQRELRTKSERDVRERATRAV